MNWSDQCPSVFISLDNRQDLQLRPNWDRRNNNDEKIKIQTSSTKHDKLASVHRQSLGVITHSLRGISSALSTFTRCHYSTVFCCIFGPVTWIFDQFVPMFNGIIPEPLTIYSDSFIRTAGTIFNLANKNRSHVSPCQTLTLVISTCSLRSWQILCMSLIFHCPPQANDNQSINVFLCLPPALLPSTIPVNAIASNWLLITHVYHKSPTRHIKRSQDIIIDMCQKSPQILTVKRSVHDWPRCVPSSWIASCLGRTHSHHCRRSRYRCTQTYVCWPAAVQCSARWRQRAI